MRKTTGVASTPVEAHGDLTPEDMHRATLNILEDMGDEKARMADVARALVNILADFESEKLRLEMTQRAALNILEDFDLEKTKSELAYRELQKLILERERAEGQVRKLNEDLEVRAADLTNANKELEAFSYSVAHDLRTPLRSIAGFSTILLKAHSGQLDAQGRELVEAVVRSTNRMGTLIDDLLNFAGIGRAQMTPSTFDMNALAESALAAVRQNSTRSEVRVELRPLPDAWGDPAMIRQVLVNLIDNAFKYSSRTAGAAVEIGSYPQEGRDVYYVKDNGAGFDQRYVDKLFGVFQRLHSRQEFEGTGIGLAIVARIVHKHGGEVWAEGKLAAGASFYFSLPSRRGGRDDGR